MKNQSLQYICVKPDYNGGPSWRFDTLSWGMKDSKKKLLGGGNMTWKECNYVTVNTYLDVCSTCGKSVHY